MLTTYFFFYDLQILKRNLDRFWDSARISGHGSTTFENCENASLKKRYERSGTFTNACLIKWWFTEKIFFYSVKLIVFPVSTFALFSYRRTWFSSALFGQKVAPRFYMRTARRTSVYWKCCYSHAWIFILCIFFFFILERESTHWI